MNDEVTSGALQRLLGINKSVLGELVEKGIAVRVHNAAPTGLRR